ncbi:MAG: tryptophanase [Candidatus Mcinerneyibacterium aminivorans]|uniref:Tryptophanase n=1 Tax=Candidatus Mcinerneyibacterium aminivorans TaxID=2703815 RepID=A0A5D0MK12_9BACT|nr:MAG: tryptophanase [Candidatus Mcinerneyibacterium aminivorans]
MNFSEMEPYKIKMVERLKTTTKKERKKFIKNAKFNLFNLKSENVLIDLLTDSGTNAMSDEQWSEIMLGDESYAGAESYFKLKETIEDLFGFEYFLPTHQGRASENVLFSALIKEGNIIPGNAHFDTTKGHIESRKAEAIDCTIEEASDTTAEHPFKGNVDLNKLQKLFATEDNSNIPFVIITITCNSAGGQPVSMKNIKDVAKICKDNDTMLLFDAARFAENAFFIKEREKGYKSKTIKEIVKEMFSYVDGFTMSCKKDGIVNIGGLIGLRSKDIYQKASTYNIMYEGYLTYGGMAGRDLGALSQGLREATKYSYLQSRIGKVKYLFDKLDSYNIPIQKPAGGHAVFIDAKKFFPQIPQSQFPAQLLGVELYIEGGIRGVEIGTLLADRDPKTGKNRYPDLELLRLAIPRRVYTKNHLDYVANKIKKIYKKREDYNKGLKIVREAPILRHFTVELERL